jgi:hypothetical protein
MIEELEGTLVETLRLLDTEPLDPRDETKFCDYWSADDGRTAGWILEGRLPRSSYGFRFRHAGGYEGVRKIAEAIHANKATAAYRAARLALLPRLDAWLRIGYKNPWIRAACDPPFSEASFALCRTVEEVARMVDRNNWTVGSTFVLADTDLCMIQQCDGPGEFLMIRGVEAFDSWTTGRPWGLHGPELVSSLQAVVRAPQDARGQPQWYWPAERATEGDSEVVVARSSAELRLLLS